MMPSAFLIAVLTAMLPVAALAQSTPDEAGTRVAAATTWTSNPGTDKRMHTRNCSVYPLRPGLYPLFYIDRMGALMSVEGGDVTPLGLKLQVDANAALDGGFPAPSEQVVNALIAQIRAGGRSLRVSHGIIANGKLQTVADDIPLDGAVEQFDRCRDWLAGE